MEYKSVLDELTEEQWEILKQFRKSLGVELNHRHTDELLTKFLRAKSFNLKAAKKIFLENYYNRINFGVNTLLDTYEKPEVAEKYESTSFIGFAKDETLVRYIAAGRLDFHGFIMSLSCFDLCLYFSHVMEQDIQMLEDQSRKTGRNITEVTYIIDLEGFHLQQILHQCVVEMGLDYLRLMQDCYPEIFRNALVVNAPRVFPAAFNLFKPVLRATAREKLQIVGRDHTKELLLKYIDADVLPEFLGGTRVDSNGDPMCKEFITFGGKVPEKFYSVHHRPPLCLGDPGVRAVNIGPRSAFNVAYVVKEAGTEVRFLARSENGSLCVSAHYKKFGPDTNDPELPGDFEPLGPEYEQVSVELRDQMHCTQEDGKVIASWPGIYVLKISNAGSWFTPRKLYYKLSITPPQPKRQKDV